jgi:polyribonucleotide nucleotidyltransferase
MVHVSELDEHRVENVEDVVQLGQEINVMVIAIEPGTGKVSLSRRAVITGETADDRLAAGAGRGTRPRTDGDRGDRPRRRL